MKWLATCLSSAARILSRMVGWSCRCNCSEVRDHQVNGLSIYVATYLMDK